MDVTVELGDRSYPISFRPLDSLGETIAKHYKVGKCVLVTNDVVGPLYGEKAMSALRKAGWNPSYAEIPDGEDRKSSDTYVALVNSLLSLQVDRKTPVIALGGGVTTDIVGFAAATTLRGIPFVNVPTTLLAQVDASVGGKTGVNTSHGKNLLGAFWQPFLVHIPIETLGTLSDAEFRCGLGEVVKHAVLEEVEDPRDKTKLVASTEFFEWLEKNGKRLANRDSECLVHAIRRCCEIKAMVVSADERESGKRALLNLGHTVGHAVESVMGYGKLRHGEAVAIGTLAEAQLACLKGFCDQALINRIAQLLRVVGLPTGIEGLEVDALVEASLMDKKREDTQISVTMIHGIGDVRLLKVTPDELIPVYRMLSGNTSQKFSVVPPAAPNSTPQVNSNAYGIGSNQNNARPSTRVRAPPGGSSSIIFG